MTSVRPVHGQHHGQHQLQQCSQPLNEVMTKDYNKAVVWKWVAVTVVVVINILMTTAMTIEVQMTLILECRANRVCVFVRILIEQDCKVSFQFHFVSTYLSPTHPFALLFLNVVQKPNSDDRKRQETDHR